MQKRLFIWNIRVINDLSFFLSFQNLTIFVKWSIIFLKKEHFEDQNGEMGAFNGWAFESLFDQKYLLRLTLSILNPPLTVWPNNKKVTSDV